MRLICGILNAEYWQIVTMK